MLKVTFVCLEWPNDYHVGGVARYAYRIAAALASRVSLTVVTFEGGIPLDGVRMVTIPRSTSRMSRYYGSAITLRRVVQSIPADLVHSFGDDWAVRRRAGVPLVRTFLGTSLAEARASTGLRKVNHYLLAITEWRSAKRANYRIAIGPDSFAQFQCDALMAPVVPVSAPGDVTKTVTPSVVFVGSSTGRKRGHLVEEAVGRVSEQLGERVRLRVIGPETDAAAWSPSTEHLAGASDAEVSSAIASSWVLMAPSLYEGFGIPMFEALSLGVASIASDNPGSAYLRSLTEPAGAISIVPDDRLAEALAARIAIGPDLTAEESAGADRAVHQLLSEASPSRLVDAIYASVLPPRLATATD